MTATPRAPGRSGPGRAATLARRPAAVASASPVRIALDSFQVQVAGATVGSSTTIGAVGGDVLVVATTLPDRVISLTSCYLSEFGGEIAASHLRSGPNRYQQVTAQVLPPAAHVGEHARACLLDHAAELQQAIADLTGEQVLVDVAAGALERAVEAWGPAAPDA